MKKKNCIYPEEIAEFTGKSLTHARRLLNKVRNHFGMPRGIPVTIGKFLKYTGYDMEEIEDYLKSKY